jgi:electron transfer flavoprotein beta subunit
MKVLIPVKRVPDPYARISVSVAGQIDDSGAAWVLNPFDEIAIEEAVRLREGGIPVEIVVVTVGGDESEPVLRTALAMGADRALLVMHEGECSSAAVAFLLAHVARQESPDLVLMGKQAIDDDNGQVGPRLAARLGVPQAAFASTLTISTDGKRARVTREVDVGRETLEVTLPAVVTTDLRLNTPRYVALPAIIKARAKPLQRIESSSLGPVPEGEMRVVKYEAPPPRRAGRRVKDVPELVAALRDEAKVI